MHHLKFAAVALLACVYAKPLVHLTYVLPFPNAQKPRVDKGLPGGFFLYGDSGNSNCSGTDLVTATSSSTDPLECVGLVSNGKQVPMFSISVIPELQVGWTVQFFDDSSCVQPQGNPVKHCGLVCVAPLDGPALSANFTMGAVTSVSQTLLFSANSLDLRYLNNCQWRVMFGLICVSYRLC
jgi:hypothetical protein